MLTWGGNNWEVYEVSGTLLDVYDAISGMAEAGKAEWNDSTYSMSFDDNGIVTSVEAVINPKVTMPTWIDSGQAPQAAQDEWNRWFTALEDHENGHLQILHDNAAGIDDRMVGKSQADAAKEWNDTFAEIQRLSDEYDGRTQNGQTEGTVMNQYAGAPDEDESRESESAEQ
jgi:predicted secreted Zn-dependent protease